MKKQIVVLGAILIAGLSSCKKDKTTNDNPEPKSKVEILTEDPWTNFTMQTKVTVNGILVQDSTESMNGKVNFLSNNTVIAQMAGEPADTSAWNLVGDTLYLDDLSYFVQSLNESKVELEFREIENDPNYKVEMMSKISLEK